MCCFESLCSGSSPSFLTPRHNQTVPKEGSKPHKIKTPNSSRPKNILIVEDEALVAENLRDVLERAGYSVVAVVSSGEAAIQTITKANVDIILMDVKLAGKLNGMETVALIHQTIKKIPVIFLTAYAIDLYPKIVNASLYRCLTKPYNQRELEQALRELS